MTNSYVSSRKCSRFFAFLCLTGTSVAPGCGQSGCVCVPSAEHILLHTNLQQLCPLCLSVPNGRHK